MKSCGTCKWWDGESKDSGGDGEGYCKHVDGPFFGDYRELAIMYEYEGTECKAYEEKP